MLRFALGLFRSGAGSKFGRFDSCCAGCTRLGACFPVRTPQRSYRVGPTSPFSYGMSFFSFFV
eukprot:scaffold26062_cov31-Tisochrysis_lutea.AAC.3